MLKVGVRLSLVVAVLSWTLISGCKGGGGSGGSMPGTAAPAMKSLYERLGGAGAIQKVVDEFVGNAAADPKVDFTRGGKWQATDENVSRLKKHLSDFIGTVTGGPEKYVGRDMKTAHKGMGITKEQFEAIAGHLKNALAKFNVNPTDASELLAKVGGTMADIVGQ